MSNSDPEQDRVQANQEAGLSDLAAEAAPDRLAPKTPLGKLLEALIYAAATVDPQAFRLVDVEAAIEQADSMEGK